MGRGRGGERERLTERGMDGGERERERERKRERESERDHRSSYKDPTGCKS